MSSSGGGSGSDEQPDESVEYSGAPVDGMVFLLLGVVAVVVIVVVVLLVVFLLNRGSQEDSVPAKQTTPGGHVCGNPCHGMGRVCRPDSAKDANGCFVQDCHCYTPNETQPCSNPCNMTGQVCNFMTSTLDPDGCYLPRCQCVTCPHHCGVDEKCDANSPYGPDGCPMPNCICVPTTCPARCRIGEQCPDVDRDMNKCLPQDCNCVPISRMTTAHTPTKSRGTTDDLYSSTSMDPCPPVCPAGRSCHPLSSVDPNGCFASGCKCVRDTCPNKCGSGEVCPYDTPLAADGCLVDTCTCVPIHGTTATPSSASTAVMSTSSVLSPTPPTPTMAPTPTVPSSPANVSARFAIDGILNASTTDGFLSNKTGGSDNNATEPEALRVPREEPDSDQDNSTDVSRPDALSSETAGAPISIPLPENRTEGPGVDDESSIAAQSSSGASGKEDTSVEPETSAGTQNHVGETTAPNSETVLEATTGGSAGQPEEEKRTSKQSEALSESVKDTVQPSSHGDAEQIGTEEHERKTDASGADTAASGDDHGMTRADTVAPASETSTVGSIVDAATSEGAAASERASDAGEVAAAVDAASDNSSKARRSVKGSDNVRTTVAAMGTGDTTASFHASRVAKMMSENFHADNPQEGNTTGKKAPQVLPVIGDSFSNILTMLRGAGDAKVLNVTDPHRV